MPTTKGRQQATSVVIFFIACSLLLDRSCTHQYFQHATSMPSASLAASSLSAADIDQLHSAVFSSLGNSRLEQLLFAKADSLDTRGADPEWINQCFANRVGALLAKLEIVFAVARGVSVAHDQKAIALQIRMIERVGHQTHSLKGTR